MDVPCSCFGVATAARVPVKRYNFLVPEIYPIIEPSFSQPIGVGVERKIKKLAEYLDRNEHRVPKVSRRLARRLYRELRAGRLGYVRLTVHAYGVLLEAAGQAKAGLYANELLVQSVAKGRRFLCVPCGGGAGGGVGAGQPAAEAAWGSVVGLLLAHPDPAARLLGVTLLTQLLALQSGSDYLLQLEGYVPVLCRDAARAPGAAAAAGPAAASSEAALSAACLRALLEHLRFCGRAFFVSAHLEGVTRAVLAALEGADPAALVRVTLASARGALPAPPSPASLRQLSVGRTAGLSAPAVAAMLVFEEISRMTQDAAEGGRVLEFVMRYLDAGQRWLGRGAALEASMAVMGRACEREHQRFLLYSALMRHVAAPGLSAEERRAVLARALAARAGLEADLAAPALLLALEVLPPVLPPAEGTAPAEAAAAAAGGVGQQFNGSSMGSAGAELRAAVAEAVRALAAAVTGPASLLVVVGAALCRLEGPTPEATAVLQCCLDAAGAAPPAQAVAAGPAGGGGGGGGGGAVFPGLLLAELQAVMLRMEAPQRLAAHRLLGALLRRAGPVRLRRAQALGLLSTLWHEAASGSATPAEVAAMDDSLRAALPLCPPEAAAEACVLAASLQLEVAQTAAGQGGRLAALPPPALCALLCLCHAALRRGEAALGLPALGALAVPRCDAALSSLALSPDGQHLELRAPANGGALPSALGFSAEEVHRSAALLSGLPGQEAAARAALAALPGAARSEEGFRPVPAAALMPLSKVGRAEARGGGGGSSEEWVQRLQEMLRSVHADRTGQEVQAKQPQQQQQQQQPTVAAAAEGSRGSRRAPAGAEAVLAAVGAELAALAPSLRPRGAVAPA